MASGRLFLPGWMPALDSDGAPIPNASVYFYLNKTDTLASVYSDEALTTPLSNPVYANSSGRFPQVWANDTVTYSYSIEAPFGPPGVPFTGDDLTVSISVDLIAVGAAEAAADEAEASAAAATTAAESAVISAAEAADALEEMETIIANTPVLADLSQAVAAAEAAQAGAEQAEADTVNVAGTALAAIATNTNLALTDINSAKTTALDEIGLASDAAVSALDGQVALAQEAADDAEAAAAQLYLPETVSLAVTFTTRQTRERMALIDNTISRLKEAGLWAKLDLLYFLAAHDEQAGRINWKNPGTYTVTATGGPTFTPDVGFTGDDVDAFLDLGVQMTALPLYSLTSRHISARVESADADEPYVFGTASTGRALIGRGASFVGALGPTSFGVVTFGATDKTGHFIVSRVNGTTLAGYRNGVLIGSGAQTAAFYDANNLCVLRSSTAFTSDTVSVVSVGLGFSDAEAAAFTEICDDYMTGLVSGADKADRNLSNIIDPTVARANIGAAASDLSLTIWQQNTVTADLRASNTKGQNGTALANAVAAAAGKTLILPDGQFLMDFSIDLTGPREVRGKGEDTILDWSTRTTGNTSLLTAFGGFATGGSIISLSANAAVGADTLAVASITGLVVGPAIIRSTAYAFQGVGAEATYGEWVDIQSITGSGPYTITLKEPLRLPYTTAASATIRSLVGGLESLTVSDFCIIGTGQTYTSGGTVNGDRGFRASEMQEVIVSGLRIEGCDYNGVALSDTRYRTVQDCTVDFLVNQDPGQIQYGIVRFGASDKTYISNCRIYRGRHGGVQAAGAGYEWNTRTEGNLVERTYSAAYSEHDGIRDMVSVDDTARFCADGFSIRGIGRQIVRPKIIDGYNATGGRAFIFRDNARDIEIIDATVNNVRSLTTTRNTTSVDGAFADNFCPGNIKFKGGTFQAFSTGFYFENSGRANSVAANNNVAVGGPITFEGCDIYCSSPREAPGSSTRAISVEGYFSEVRVEGGKIAYPSGDTPYYSVVSLGVGRTILRDVEWDGTWGVLTGKDSVLNASGAGVSDRYPAYVGWDGVKWFNPVTGKKMIEPSEAISTMVTAGTVFDVGTDNTTIGQQLLTIASNAVTPSGRFHAIHSGAADNTPVNLNTINDPFPGCLLTLCGFDGRTTVFKNGTGNLRLGADITLNSSGDTITLVGTPAGTVWNRQANCENVT